MSDKNIKEIRKQLRGIVQELLPELLTEAQVTELKKHIDAQIKQIESSVKQTMSEMNNRHKDTMGYLVRQASSGPKKEDLK